MWHLFKKLTILFFCGFLIGCGPVINKQTMAYQVNQTPSPTKKNIKPSISYTSNQVSPCNTWCHNLWCSVHCGPIGY